MRITCCKDCTKRKLGCHSECAEYNEMLKQYRTERIALNNMYKWCRSFKTQKMLKGGAFKCQTYR